MTPVATVSLSVSGLVNNEPVSASGTMDVDEATGTKHGEITVRQTNGRRSMLPIDLYQIPIPRCFVGALPMDSKVVNPLRLLGRQFVSLRVTDLGSHGRISQAERATLVGSTLTSDQLVFGQVQRVASPKVARIREVIRISGHGELTGVGRYVIVTDAGREIPVRYRHIYRSLTPDAGLFRTLQERKFLLKVELKSKQRGSVVSVRTFSTIGYE